MKSISQILSGAHYAWLRFRSLPALALYRVVGIKIGNKPIIQTITSCLVTRPHSISIGDRVQICRDSSLWTGDTGLISIGSDTGLGKHTSICALGDIYIGSGCLFSDWVNISDSEHIITPCAAPIHTGLKFRSTVRIGARCFIGRMATILPGSILGDDCVVGAHSVVNSEFPSRSVIAGIPARLIKTL